ncbi:MAG: protein kinase [Planctomycetota bacterium]|nr:protein kinase [Planctomycetota bacterium]
MGLLVTRCLAKSPEARYVAALDLAAAIRALLHEMGAKQSGSLAVHKAIAIPAGFPPEAALPERLRGHVDQTMAFIQSVLDGTSTAETDRQHAARLAKEREREEQLQREQEARENAAREQQGKERAEAERKERERQEQLKREKEAHENAERERHEKERAEAGRKERERGEQLKREKEARENAERQEKERVEAERKERERQEQLKREQEARENAERERQEKARLQAERARQTAAPNGERGHVPKEVLEKTASGNMTPSPQQGNLTGGRVMATQPSAASAQRSEAQEPKSVPASEIQPRLNSVPADRYQVRREISLGGQGACKIAYDQLADREVVLKASSPQGGWSPERIIKEARYAAKFNHPNVSRLLELGAFGKDQVLMTMPLVEGSSLDVVLKKISEAGIPGLTGYSMLAVAELFEKICAGVEHAHSTGILHLDLKPQNVIVGSRGEVVVVDWGLAQPLNAAELPKRYASTEQQPGAPNLNTTLSGSLASDASVRAIGTPAYLSPEQWAGDPGTFTERTDVYGLGAVLFYLLTGCAPNQVQRPTDLDPYFRHSPTPLPSDFTRRRVPPELESLCVKCLCRDPAQRYPSAFHVRHVLKSWLSRPEMWGLYGASY